jgi:hypothetical protein
MEVSKPSADKTGWRCRSASDMPVEWLMQCMSFLPLPDKFVSRSVCKKWYVAGREVLKDQDELTLSLYKKPGLSEVQSRNAMHIMCQAQAATGQSPGMYSKVQIPEFMDQRIKLLSHLKHLEKITITYELAAACNSIIRAKDIPFHLSFAPIVDSLISSHSLSLTSLDMSIYRFSSDTSDSLMFPHLKELACWLMTEKDISRCPSLRKLSVKYTASLEHLPIGNMVELNLTNGWFSPDMLNTWDARLRKEMVHLLLVVPRLVNLKVLRIGRLEHFMKIPDELSEFMKKLLKGLTKLEVLSLRLTSSFHGTAVEYNDNELMQQLVETNPCIRGIDNLYLTEKGIRSLSSLNHLKEVTGLTVAPPDQFVPMLMVILLSGNSGHCLQKVEVSMRYVRDQWNTVRDGVVVKGLTTEFMKAGLPFKISAQPFGSSDNFIIVRDSVSMMNQTE